MFSNTKIGASRLARYLEQAGIKASAIHGDKTQQERIAALDAFKKGEIDVLVATDVAARGLDITDLPCVINYDLPYNAEDYVHRIGRTGRAGASGDALSVYSDKDERLLVDIEKLIKQTITRGELTGFAPRAAQPRPSATASARERSPERSASVAQSAVRASSPRRAERSDRGERSERGPRRHGRARAATRSIRGSSSPTSRPRRRARNREGPAPVGQAKPKQKLAALLGGLAEAVSCLRAQAGNERRRRWQPVVAFACAADESRRPVASAILTRSSKSSCRYGLARMSSPRPRSPRRQFVHVAGGDQHRQSRPQPAQLRPPAPGRSSRPA